MKFTINSTLYLKYTLIILVGGFLFATGTAHADYNALPTVLPNAATNGSGAGQHYINISDDYQTGSSGFGAYHPESFLKVYTQTLNGQPHIITADLQHVYPGNANCGGYTSQGIHWDILNLGSDESQRTVDNAASGSYNVRDNGCGVFTITIPDRDFSLANPAVKPEHAGIYTAGIRLWTTIAPVGSPTHSYFMILNSSSSPTDTKLGYLPDALGGTVIYPKQNLTNPLGGLNTVSMTFRPSCNVDGGAPILYGEDDYNTANQPHLASMSLHLLVYNATTGAQINDITIAADSFDSAARVNTNAFSGGTFRSYAYSWKAGEKYKLEFRNVTGGNGIWIQQPFDSGDFDIGCIPQPTVKLGVDGAVCGQTDIGGWAIGPNGETVGIDAYFDGPAGTGQQFLFGAVANGARGDVWNGHGYVFSIPPGLKDGSGHLIYIYALDPSGNNVNTGPGTALTFGPDPVTMTGCHFTTSASTNLSLVGGSEDPSGYTTTSNVNVRDDSDPNFKPSIGMSCTVTATKNGGQIGSQACAQGFPANNVNIGINGPNGAISGATAGDNFCSHITIQYQQGYVYRDGTAAGTTGPRSVDSGCPVVVNEPTFKAYGSSVAAGGSLGSCDNSGGMLAGWNAYNAGSNDFGSGGELSALALVKIVGYASAQTVATREPNDLSFANKDNGLSFPSTDIDSPTTGGGFGGIKCINDEDPTTPVAGNVQPGLVVPVASKIGVKYSGDVYISGNIVYAGNSGGPGGRNVSWNAVDQIPSFTLRAAGNIYIDNDAVTELDGTYIAGGKIYTCAYGVNNPVPKDYLFSNCHTQLVTYGSFLANKINLMRTYGSLRDEKPSAGGTQTSFYWTSKGGVDSTAFPADPAAAGMQCTQIDEPNDPAWPPPAGNGLGWHDNYLCVPGGSLTKLVWTNSSKTQAQATNFAKSKGIAKPTCTNWNIPVAITPDTYSWSNDWLCSNTVIQFSDTGPLDPVLWACTQVYEGSDSNSIWWKSNNQTYLCEQKVAAITAGNVGPSSCSNNITGPSKRQGTVPQGTCAAEIFDFSPELYLADPAISPPSNGSLKYQSITSLPPVL